MASTAPGVNRAAQDVVAMLDGVSFSPLFIGSNVMRCTVRETITLTKWPVEDGTQRTDHRYVNAIEIDLPLLLTVDTRALYEQLRTAFLNSTLLTVQTRVSSYNNMLIVAMPHDEIVEQGESIPLDIKLEELRTVEAEFGTLPPASVTNKTQASTVKKGAQQTTETDAPTQRKASVLYGVLN